MSRHSTEVQQETAILVGLTTQQQTEEQTLEYLDELAFLAETSGAKTVKQFSQKREKPDNKTLFPTKTNFSKEDMSKS